jgi:hypothetical protein
MTIFRLLLLFLFGLLVRRFYLSVKSRVMPNAADSSAKRDAGDMNNAPTADQPMKDLTEQDISDADFEEIP